MWNFSSFPTTLFYVSLPDNFSPRELNQRGHFDKHCYNDSRVRLFVKRHENKKQIHPLVRNSWSLSIHKNHNICVIFLLRFSYLVNSSNKAGKNIGNFSTLITAILTLKWNTGQLTTLVLENRWNHAREAINFFCKLERIWLEMTVQCLFLDRRKCDSCWRPSDWRVGSL